MATSRFRLDNEVLSFRFTATRIDRSERPRELLERADDLRDWLGLHGLQVRHVVDDDLPGARKLREAIHRCGTALAEGRRPASVDLLVINRAAASGRARQQLAASGSVRWDADGGLTVIDALGVLAEDAIEHFGRQGRRLKVCEDPSCRGLFVDHSRAGIRRWCSMNFCGNRQKKQNYRHGPTTR